MSELIHTAEFWYVLCVFIIFAITIGGIKHYLKTIIRKNAEKEINHGKNDTEN